MPTVQQLMQYLQSNSHIGKGAEITANELAQHFGISDGGQEVPMRNVIRNAITNGQLIGSSNQGFYLIQTKQELEFNLDSLTNRAEATLTRRRNMLTNWNKNNPQNVTNKCDLFVKP